jgi:hypothetical protein
VKNLKKVTKPEQVKDLSLEDKEVLDAVLDADESSKTASGGCHLARQVFHMPNLPATDPLSRRVCQLISRKWLVNNVAEPGMPHYEVSVVYTKALQRTR